MLIFTTTKKISVIWLTKFLICLKFIKITLHTIDKNIQIYILFKIENTYMYVRTTSVGIEVIYNHLERKKKENNNNIKQKW